MIFSRQFVDNVCRGLHDWWDTTEDENLKETWRSHLEDALYDAYHKEHEKVIEDHEQNSIS